MARFDISIVVGLKDQASRALGRLEGQVRRNFASIGQISGRALGRLEVGLGRMASRARLLGLGLAALGGLGVRNAIAAFTEYEQSVRNAVTVTGLSGAAAQKAEKEMYALGLALSRASMKTAPEVASAFYELASAGLSVQQSMEAARGVIALAEATQTDMGLAAQLVTSQLAAFGLEARQTDRLVNVFAATIGSTLMKMYDLATAFPYVGSSARTLGVSVEETAAALGVLRNAGLDASMTGTGLRMVFMRLSKQGGQGQEILKRYGLRMQDLDVQSRGLIPVIRTLARAHLSFADTVQLFDIRGANAAQILMRQVDALDALARRITGTNMAYQMQRQQLDTLYGRWKIFQSTLAEAYTGIGQRIAPALSALLDSVNALLAKMIDTSVIRQWGDAFAGSIRRVTEWVTGGGLERLAQEFGVLRQRVAAELRVLAALLGDAWAAIKSGVSGLGGGLWQWLLGRGAFPTDLARGLVGPLAAAVETALMRVLAYVQGKVPAVQDMVARVFQVGPGEAAAIVASWRETAAAVGASLANIAAASARLAPLLVRLVESLLRFAAAHPRLVEYGLLALVFQRLTGLLPLLVVWLGRTARGLWGVFAWLARATGAAGGLMTAVKALGRVLGPVLTQVGAKVAGVAGALLSLYEIVKTILAAIGLVRAKRQEARTTRDMLRLLGAEGRRPAEVIGAPITPEQLRHARGVLGLPPGRPPAVAGVAGGPPLVQAPAATTARAVTVNINAPVFGVDDLEAKIQSLAARQVRDALAPA